MSKRPPENLDPFVAIRDPGSLPKLLQWGMYDLLTRDGDMTPTEDDMVKAFNVIAWSLLTAGPGRNGTEARLKVDPKDKTRSKLTPLGEDRERDVLKRPTPSATAKKPRARSRKKKKPWMPFEQKARALASWASSIYDNNPDRYGKTWQEARPRSG